MLIISRKKAQKIVVADEIEITVLEIRRNRVRFGINAPKDVRIETRLKQSPRQSLQLVESEKQTSPAEGIPAVAGIAKRR